MTETSDAAALVLAAASNWLAAKITHTPLWKKTT